MSPKGTLHLERASHRIARLPECGEDTVPFAASLHNVAPILLDLLEHNPVMSLDGVSGRCW